MLKEQCTLKGALASFVFLARWFSIGSNILTKSVKDTEFSMTPKSVVIFFVIILISVVVVFVFAVIRVIPQYRDQQVLLENEELKTRVASIQQLATTESIKSNDDYQLIVKTAIWQQEAFTATLTAQEMMLVDTDKMLESLSNTATVMANTVTANQSNLEAAAAVVKTATALHGTSIAIADQASTVAETATAIAPRLVKLIEGESVSLFTEPLTITLDGYSSILSKQKANFSVHTPESVKQTFQGQERNSSVFYEGRHRYSIVVTGISEENKLLTVSLVVTQW